MRHESGMSLVETMIVTTVLATMGAGVASFLNHSVRANRTATVATDLEGVTRLIVSTIRDPLQIYHTISRSPGIFGNITPAPSGCVASNAACASIDNAVSIWDRVSPIRLAGTKAEPIYYSLKGQHCDPKTAPCPADQYPAMAISWVVGSGSGVKFSFCIMIRDDVEAWAAVPDALQLESTAKSKSCATVLSKEKIKLGKKKKDHHAILRPTDSQYDPDETVGALPINQIALSASKFSCPPGQVMRSFMNTSGTGMPSDTKPICVTEFTPTPLPPTPVPTPITLPGGGCAVGAAAIKLNANGSIVCGEYFTPADLVPHLPAAIAAKLPSVVPACGGGSALSYNGGAFTCQTIRPIRCEHVTTLPPIVGGPHTHYQDVQCPAGSYPIACWAQTTPCGLLYCNNNGAEIAGATCGSWTRRKDHPAAATVTTGVTCMPWDFSNPPAPISATPGAVCSYW